MTDTSNLRVVVEVDETPSDVSGDWLPKTKEDYEQGGPFQLNGRDVTWEEWSASPMSNIWNYTDFGFILERRCSCCGAWGAGRVRTPQGGYAGKHQASLWGINYYNLGEIDLPEPNVYTVDEFIADRERAKDKHAIEVVQELIAELPDPNTPLLVNDELG